MIRRSIIQIQTGNEDAGGIANYISLLVASKNLNSFQNVVTVKTVNCKIKKKYLRVKFEKFDNEITPLNLLKRVFSLREISKKYENPLFHSHALKSGILVAFLKLIFNKKFIHTNHGLRFTQKKRNLFLIFLLLEILVIILSDKYICIRNIDYYFLKNNFKFKFLTRKIELIKLHLDTRLNSNEKVCLNKFKKPYTLVSIGSLIEIKRPRKFIYLIDLLVKNGIPIKGVWLGGGPLKNKMIELTNLLNVDIAWQGEVCKEKVISYLNKATYLVQTSEFEVYPTVVLESFSCGTPVISSTYWGVEELIKDEKNGIILDERFFIKDKKNKLINLFLSKFNYEKMSNYSKNYFLNYHSNYNNTSIRYKNIYDKIFT